MNIVGRIAVTLVALLIVAGLVVYVDGAMLPVNHSTSVSGTVDAPPAKVFALIANIPEIPSWRHSVQSVQVLPPEDGRDRWIEDLGHGQTMKFLAVRSEPVDPSGAGRREVQLNEPEATYGGTWTYDISPSPTPNQTSLRITETGFIKPPVYRFMMTHLFGMTRNLDQYMADAKAAVLKK